MDTGQKMFRRRQGRLLNVLCTFNSRSVSSGLGIDLRLFLSYSIFTYFIPLEKANNDSSTVKLLLTKPPR